MKISHCTPETYQPSDARWLLWSGLDQTLLEPWSNSRWNALREGTDADRILVLGEEESAEFRRLSGRGWKGRCGRCDGSTRLQGPLRFAGGGSLLEGRVDARRSVAGESLPQIFTATGFIAGPDGAFHAAILPFVKSQSA